MSPARQPWIRRLQATVAQETAFLPKRLSIFTLLLLGIYGVLLLRTEWHTRNSDNGLIAAALQSKLEANYALAEPGTLAFAPLSLDLVQDKIRDENPHLPANQIASLIETVMAAAHEPIIAATSTPGLQQATILQSARVIGTAISTEITTESTSANPQSQAVALAFTQEAGSAPPTMPTQPVLTPPVAMMARATPTLAEIEVEAPLVASTPAQSMVAPSPTPVAATSTTQATPELLSVLPLPSATATATPLATQPVATQTQATQPVATATPEPSITPLPSLTATRSATVASATSVPVVTLAAPTATNTIISFVPVKPTATPTMPPPIALPTSTPLPTVIGMATVVEMPTATSPPTLPSPTLPPPTLTASPTATTYPTSLAIGPPPAVHNLKARIEEDQVYLEWAPIESAGLVGYNIYHSHTQPVQLGTLVNKEPLIDTLYVDKIMRDGSQSFYVVTAVNQLQQESLPSLTVTVNAPDLSPPSSPINIAVSLNGDQVQMTWQTNQETDLAGYHVYRSTQLPVDRTLGSLNGPNLLTSPVYQDTIVRNGQTYYYVFTAVDLAGNESQPSIEGQIPTTAADALFP